MSITTILIPQQQILPQGHQSLQSVHDKRKLQRFANQHKSQGSYAQRNDGNYCRTPIPIMEGMREDRSRSEDYSTLHYVCTNTLPGSAPEVQIGLLMPRDWKPRVTPYFAMHRGEHPCGCCSQGGCKRQRHKPINIRERIAIRCNGVGMYGRILWWDVSKDEVGAPVK